MDGGVGHPPRPTQLPSAAASSDGNVRSMQATVATFDPESRCGTVVLDDGTELRFDAAAFDAGGLRLLRFGQRVNIAVADDASSDDGTPAITAVTLATFPLPRTAPGG